MIRYRQFAIWALAVLTLAPLAAAQTYHITDLGTFPGGTVSQGDAINLRGEVAGYARFANYNAHGFEWKQGGKLQNLSPIAPGSDFAVAEAINAVGQVAGYSTYNPEDAGEHAVLWVRGSLADLGTLPGGTLSQAMGINDAGEVTGFSDGGESEPHAFLWNKTQGMQDLGTLPGGYYSQGLGINNKGQVVGYSNDAKGNWHGFVWSKSAGIVALAAPPNTGVNQSANAINDLGQIAGGSAFPTGNFAALWTPDNTIESLGALPGQGWSSAFAINNLGQVVGWSGYLAFFWSSTTGMLDLNTLIPPNSGWILTAAFGINGRGQITGEGDINGQTHAFVLTPD
ncbi:MAG TPA: hypothetical protein VG860_09985 [Terriglobia bacterium]|jgi:probable HAF family extracellular repeat protein|nr:hypothetical protein [Terriglobia bacterium]